MTDAVRRMGDYYIHDTLGKGGYSWVKKGIHRTNKAIFALKFMSKADQSWAQEQTRQVATEIEALSQIDSKHVIKLYEYDVQARYPEKNGKELDVILLVLEYAPGGELFDILYYTNALDEVVARTYFRQLVDGLEACHKAGVCHRDVKPQNLLLNSQFQLKITDFGLSKIFETDADSVMTTMYVGTRGYQAPELLIRKPYTVKADVFSAAVVLFILLAGYPPFESAAKKDKWFKPVIDGDFKKFWKAHRGCGISDGAKDLLSKMLEYDPDKRISIEEIKMHPWVLDKVLSEKELYTALRQQHRKAEIRRKNDTKKAADLQQSVKRSVGDEKTQVPVLPPDFPRTLTQFHTQDNAPYVMRYFETVLGTKLKAAVVRSSSELDQQGEVPLDEKEQPQQQQGAPPSNAFKLRAVIQAATATAPTAANLELEVSVYNDEAAGMNLVNIKRTRGNPLTFRKVYRLLRDLTSPLAFVEGDAEAVVDEE